MTRKSTVLQERLSNSLRYGILTLMDLRKGLYEHFKGKRYEVIDVARHSETLEPMVVYKALYKGEYPEGSLWVRPLKMFQETVVRGGKEMPRFRYLGDAK